MYAQDLFRTAGSIKMRQEKFQEASDVMLRFGACCDVTDSAPSLCKAYLSAIIALLYAGDGVGAATSSLCPPPATAPAPFAALAALAPPAAVARETTL